MRKKRLELALQVERNEQREKKKKEKKVLEEKGQRARAWERVMKRLISPTGCLVRSLMSYHSEIVWVWLFHGLHTVAM
jgi:hypothetical protein